MSGAIHLRLDRDGLDAMRRFAEPFRTSHDIDPVYPVLREYYALRGFGAEEALWHTYLYLCYYDVGSAVAAYLRAPHPLRLPRDVEILRLPCATERRGLRAFPALLRALTSYIGVVGVAGVAGGEQAAWLGQGLGVDKYKNFEALWMRLQTVWGVGRWAAFKWLDLLANTHGMNVAAPDMRLRDCSGPRASLARLYGLDVANIEGLEVAAVHLRANFFPEWSWEELETLLCDFGALWAGRYYAGHDIDGMLEDIWKAAIPDAEKSLLLEARARALPRAYLGEVNGWRGVDGVRQKEYVRYGRIVVRE